MKFLLLVFAPVFVLAQSAEVFYDPAPLQTDVEASYQKLFSQMKQIVVSDIHNAVRGNSFLGNGAPVYHNTEVNLFADADGGAQVDAARLRADLKEYADQILDSAQTSFVKLDTDEVPDAMNALTVHIEEPSTA